ncbi:hypothetical protein [Shimia sp. R9_3]|uniref:hypothetical protein n=1 Tax=Shimia sp. R9_3 TaxID=2821113 RepID=UPI001ADBB06F|nr:hypothetical protein [Shimia sp. R9_3]MBO9403344.1 hypothetical protein [Shimia sp. R9_3]
MSKPLESLLGELRSLQEAAEKLGKRHPNFDYKSYMEEIWSNDCSNPARTNSLEEIENKSDLELSNNLDLQYRLLTAAYLTCDDREIDQAVNRVSNVRRMKKQGIFDLMD